MGDGIDTILLHGIAASPGLACGVSFIHYDKLSQIKMVNIQSSRVRSEVKRLNMAIDKSKKGLEILRSKARSSVGNDLSRIFDAQMMILEDDHFMDRVRQGVIAKLQNVEYVYQQEVNKTIRALARSKDEYMREMISDINSVSTRLLRNLSGIEDISRHRSRLPVIAFAPFFSPGKIMKMRESNVVGFVTERGGTTSHMALFAKALGIPAVVGVKGCMKRIRASIRVCLDGHVGNVVVAPSPDEWMSFKKEIDSQKRREKRRFVAIGEIPSETSDGRRVEVSANLDVPTEYDKRLAEENIGVGLYRTEFLYLNSEDFPDEEMQFVVYSKIVKQFSPQTVILRTFDLGGDKFSQHFKDDNEPNPALGWRAIRFSLDVPRVFRTQLRAMLRASVYGNIKIMFPMISSVEQVARAKRILANVMRDLSKQRIPFDESIQIGIMIEIPSAVITASRLALEVDFFSIGSNDLTQYTLAVDRGNTKVAKWYRQYHPAVLRLIANTIQAGHDGNIDVGLCGELAGDPIATKMLIGFGIDSLSTNLSSIRAVKAIIPAVSYEEAKEFSQEILSQQSTNKIERMLRDDYQEQHRTASGRMRN